MILRRRVFNSPSVFMVRKMAPCMANIATVVTPTSSAKGVSRSKSVILMLPRASSATPLITLPKATPNSSASPSDDSQKT